MCVYRHVITLGLHSKYNVDGHYSYSRSESLRLHLVGHCQYDVIQYDVIQYDTVTVATLPHAAVVLYATI